HRQDPADRQRHLDALTMQIVLASASPRRQQLLREAGIGFVVKPANIPEIRKPGEAPRVFAERMAREKAHAVHLAAANGEIVVIGADTIVAIDDEVLGKPADKKDAARMLLLLSGRKHHVITGVCLCGSGFEDVRSDSTAVYFSAISEAQVSAYIE